MSSSSPFKPFSRRQFVRSVGIGTASAAISLSAPHLLTTARAQSQQEQGFITLDAILISYFSVPPGEHESATWSFQRKYSTTFTIKSAQNPEIVFKSNVKAGSEASGIQGVQMNSSRVNTAITFFPGATGLVSTKVFDPVFFALLTPRLFIRGTPDKLRFRFDSIGATGNPYVSDPRFATNILSAYRTCSSRGSG